MPSTRDWCSPPWNHSTTPWPGSGYQNQGWFKEVCVNSFLQSSSIHNIWNVPYFFLILKYIFSLSGRCFLLKKYYPHLTLFVRMISANEIRKSTDIRRPDGFTNFGPPDIQRTVMVFILLILWWCRVPVYSNVKNNRVYTSASDVRRYLYKQIVAPVQVKKKKTTTKRFKFWKSNTTAIKIKIKYLGRIWRKEGREEIGCSDAPRLDISCLQWNANRWCLLLCSGRVQWRLFTRWVPTTSTRELLNAVPAELYPQFFRR